MTPAPYYRKTLHRIFDQRSARNPRYSIRAFATQLGVDSSVCSQILSGKRVPSLGVAERLMDQLNLDVYERKAFLQSIGETKLKQGKSRINPALRRMAETSGALASASKQEVGVEEFQAVSRWYYFAILELTKLPDFKPTPGSVARALGLSETEARQALDRLVTLGYLSLQEGRLQKSAPSFHTADPHLTSSAHRRRQLEILQKSIHALEHEPIHRRNHSAMTVAIDPALIHEAKLKISHFLSELSQFLESGGSKEVYEIQLGLFSLQTSPSTKGFKK